MGARPELTVIDSRYQSASRCLVCNSDIPDGAGVTARYAGRTLRFKCTGCYARFEEDPGRYLGRHEPACCEPEAGASPASEWRCD